MPPSHTSEHPHTRTGPSPPPARCAGHCPAGATPPPPSRAPRPTRPPWLACEPAACGRVALRAQAWPPAASQRQRQTALLAEANTTRWCRPAAAARLGWPETPSRYGSAEGDRCNRGSCRSRRTIAAAGQPAAAGHPGGRLTRIARDAPAHPPRHRAAALFSGHTSRRRPPHAAIAFAPTPLSPHILSSSSQGRTRQSLTAPAAGHI